MTTQEFYDEMDEQSNFELYIAYQNEKAFVKTKVGLTFNLN